MSDRPRILLGRYPTPVEPLPSLSRARTALWVKRDDLTSPLYGGNKVRKLEYVLADARAKGKARLLTTGAAGSHHVLATALYGAQHGFRVGAALVAQPRTALAPMTLQADLCQGLDAWPSSQAMLPWALARRMRGAYFVHPGGSSVLGALGYVDAARELAAQVRRGEMPMPDLVVVTLGTGGTSAGLAAGFALEGMPTRVLGVSIVEPVRVFAEYAHFLARRVARLAGHRPPRARLRAQLDTTAAYLGRGYAYRTPAGEHATLRAAEVGLTLDPAYTAKAFAAALDEVARGDSRVILFWHTLSSAPLEPLVAGGPRRIPAPLAKLLFDPD